MDSEYIKNTSCAKWEYTKWDGWMPRIMISTQNDITVNLPYTKWDSWPKRLRYQKAQNPVCPFRHIHCWQCVCEYCPPE